MEPTDGARLGWEIIDPETAVRYLAKNEGNRRPRPQVVALYARQMRERLWRDDNPDPVVFDTSGSLRNGQHRLEGIIESGESIRMLVLRGADPELHRVIDTGVARTAADLLVINQGMAAHRAASYAAAVRGLVAWERQPERGPVQDGWTRLANHEVLDELPRRSASMDRYYPLAEAIEGAGLRGGRGLWLCLLCRFGRCDDAPEQGNPPLGQLGIAADQVEEFAEKLAAGVELSAGSPILALRNRLLAVRPVVQRSHRMAVARMAVYAWNAWRQGRSLKHIKEGPTGRADDTFPAPE